MVSATILADGAARNVTRAAYAPGPAGAAVRAVGPSAAAACPAAIPAPAPAAPPTVTRPTPARNLRRSTGQVTRPDRSAGRPAGRPARFPGRRHTAAAPTAAPPAREPLPHLLFRLTFSAIQSTTRSISASRSYSDAERNTLISPRPPNSCHFAACARFNAQACCVTAPPGQLRSPTARSQPAGQMLPKYGQLAQQVTGNQSWKICAPPRTQPKPLSAAPSRRSKLGDLMHLLTQHD